MTNNKTFTIGQLVTFQIPAAWTGMKKYTGYISSLPEDNDPYNRYTIKILGGVAEMKIGEKLIRKMKVLGCTMYHELVAII